MRELLTILSRTCVVGAVLVGIILMVENAPVGLIVSTAASLLMLALVSRFMAAVLEWLEIIANLIAKKK